MDNEYACEICDQTLDGKTEFYLAIGEDGYGYIHADRTYCVRYQSGLIVKLTILVNVLESEIEDLKQAKRG